MCRNKLDTSIFKHPIVFTTHRYSFNFSFCCFLSFRWHLEIESMSAVRFERIFITSVIGDTHTHKQNNAVKAHQTDPYSIDLYATGPIHITTLSHNIKCYSCIRNDDWMLIMWWHVCNVCFATATLTNTIKHVMS